MIRLIQGMSLPYAGRLLINRRKFSLDIEACTDTIFFFFFSCPQLHTTCLELNPGEGACSAITGKAVSERGRGIRWLLGEMF